MSELLQYQEEIQKLRQIIVEKDQLISALQEIIAILRNKKFAPQSEIVSSKELGLFNEIEDIEITSDNNKEKEEEEELEEITYKRRKNRKKRLAITEDLPRIDEIIDLPENEKFCPITGKPLKKIGEEISEKLRVTPAKVVVIRTIRIKYVSPEDNSNIRIASLPPSILPKTMATSSLIAYIIIAKFMDALPLNRQSKMFARIGAIITRQTMSRWLVKVYFQLIPLYNLLQDQLLDGNYIQMDETYTQVLKEDGRKATTKSYIWVRFSPGMNPTVLYDYSPTRSGQVPLELLEGFEGYLQCDGYDGYSPVTQNPKIIRVGCMNHCRSKFYEAYKVSNKKKSIGKKGLIFLKKLYKIEEKIENLSNKERYEIRQNEAQPILDEMKRWIDETRSKITPQSLAGKAINYAYNEWKYLIRYLDDGKLNISNIWVENKIRPFAVGRKNWLFSASVDGAKASAMFYSLIETAKANNIEPFDYLNKMFQKLPHAKSVDDYEKLLPLTKFYQV